jgi:hypothetical protein
MQAIFRCVLAVAFAAIAISTVALGADKDTSDVPPSKTNASAKDKGPGKPGASSEWHRVPGPMPPRIKPPPSPSVKPPVAHHSKKHKDGDDGHDAFAYGQGYQSGYAAGLASSSGSASSSLPVHSLQSACSAELARYCSGVSADVGKQKACLIQFITLLKPTCRERVSEAN